jgi:hypothetical protein
MSNPLFEQQFEKDSKLEHLIFPDVWFFFEEDEKFYPAELELFGRSSKTEIFNDGAPYAYSRNSALGESELVYRISEKNGELLTVRLHNGELYKLSLSDFDQYTAHVNKFNIPYIKAEESFRNTILEQLQKLLEDAELEQMTLNFIDGVPAEILLDPINIIGFECFLEFEAKVGRSLLLSDELQRSSVSQETEEIVEVSPDEFGTTTSLTVENFEILRPYWEDNFLMFASFLKNHISSDEDKQVLYLTHLYLNKIAVQYFSTKWAGEYKNKFKNLSELEFLELLEQYSLIETVNPKDMQTMGTFVYFLMANNKFDVEFSIEDDNYLSCSYIFQNLIDVVLEQKKHGDFTNKLKRSNSKKRYTINDVDLMNGIEFEHFLKELFSQMGYEARVTKASGDQGIDVIAEKDGNKIGIQAKCYSGSVGNSAIQEAVAGIQYYHLDKAIVVTNSSYTDSAIKLANANSIVLWDRNILKEKISEVF